jgi:hypothetical protein
VRGFIATLGKTMGKDSMHGGSADVQLTGDLGFGDSGEVKFSDLACLFPDRQIRVRCGDQPDCLADWFRACTPRWCQVSES